MLMLGRKPVSPLCMPYAGIEKATNCILEIPQNIKLELNNNVLTLKSGSILVNSGSTYSTYTTTSDLTVTAPNTSATEYMIFMYGNNNFAGATLDNIVSGSTDSKSGVPYHVWFDTTNKIINRYGSNGTTAIRARYPICIVKTTSARGSWDSFVKDSNGNDMIFNGAGFIGHHAFVYPGVKALIPNGFNSDDSYRNIEINRNTLYIKELPLGTQKVFIINNNSVWTAHYKGEVNDINDIPNVNGIYYVKNLNKNIQMYNNEKTEYTGTLFISYTYNNIVSDFTIQQPLTKYRWVVKLIP